MSITVLASSSAAKQDRIAALDFAKGALVLTMVLYHWINYFVGADWPYYRYLRFLTPSFIFVSGFLISNVYLTKYRGDSRHLTWRLVSRGLKLLVIFLALNLARIAMPSRMIDTQVSARHMSLENLALAFASGNVYANAGKLVAFYILVPIGYLLILSALLERPYRKFKWTFHLALGCTMALILVFYLGGIKSDNLQMVGIGLLGAWLGFNSIEKINRVIRYPFALAILYVGYLIAITIWNVPFALLAFGAVLNVLCIYLIGLRIAGHGILPKQVNLLGKYSLFGYIAQIAILQILHGLMRSVSTGPLGLVVSFLAAFVLTTVSVILLDRMRHSSTKVDSVYRAIFA